MESEDTEIDQVPKNNSPNCNKPGVITTHALGLQDLYKAAFSQETVNNFKDITDKAISITTLTGSSNLVPETSGNYFGGNVIIETEPKSGVICKNPNFNETYQVYTLKGLQYSFDFVKPQENSLDVNHVNFEEGKVEKFEGDEVLSSASVITQSYESFQNDSSSVLDLDKGVQIHLIKSDGIPGSITATTATNSSSPITYNYQNCEYTGDAQILHRYLCDSASLKSDSETNSSSPIEMVTVNFVKQNNSSLAGKNFYDSDSVGVNPETLGVRFEDCDFNSSDSFASTESIIPKNIKCPKCPKKFMFKSDLLRHDKYKHSVKPKLFCKYCNKEFLSQQNLLFHEKSHKRNSHKCVTCKKVFKKPALLVKHMMKKHSKYGSYLCSHCGKIYTSEMLLNNHIRRNHVSDNEKPFKCEICSKGFEKKQGLSSHVKAHQEEQLHACQQCDKKFSKVCYLKNHQKSHLNETFGCDTCGQYFRTSKALSVHNIKHMRVKPFTCNVCMKSFASKHSFKIHIKKHDEETSQTCGNCQKTFATSEELNKHECVRSEQDFSQQSQQDFSQQNKQDLSQQSEQDFSQAIQQDFSQPNQQDVSEPSTLICPANQIIQTNLPQSVFAQTVGFEEGVTTIPNVTLQNVNVIVDPSFAIQQPIFLTSFGTVEMGVIQ